MPEFKAGRAYIEVAPSLKGFRRQVERDLKTELSGAGESAGAQVGRNIGDGAEKGVQGSGRRSAEKFAGEFDKQVRTRIQAALKALPEAKIDADSSEAQRKIQELRVGLVELSDKRIGIDLDAAEANAQIDWIRREMESIDGETLTIDAKVNAAAAIAELDKLKAKADIVSADDVNIDANVDTAGAHASLSALQAHASSTAMSISSIGLAIGALGPALIPLAAGGAVALAGIGGAAVGAAGGLGVLVGALAPVIGGVKALGEADAASGKSSAAAAKARQTAADRIQDAARSVRDAEESSAQRISDAQERVAQTHEQGAERVTSALRKVQDAEARLADAQRQSLDAQRAINDAREEARRTLEDLSLDLSGAQLRERSATLALAEAQQRLESAKRNWPGYEGPAMDKVQLAYDEAVQSLAEAKVRTERLAKAKADADKKGIAGSDAVVKAQDRATKAADSVKGAERDLSDARKDAAKAQRDADRENAKAQRDLVRAQRDGAKQIEAAQRTLARAMRDTGDVGSAAMDKVNKAMANLSPAGAAFSRFLFSLKDGLIDLSKVAQTGMLPGLMDGMKSLGKHAGIFRDAVKGLSETLGTLFRDMGKALAGPWWTQFFQFLAAKSPKWLDMLGRTLGAAATGMAGLLQAFAPLIDMMGEGTLSAMERFADWAKGLGENKGFQRFLGYLKETGPKVVDFLKEFFRAVGNISVALAPFGTGVLDGLTTALKWIADQDPDHIRAIATTVLGFAAAMKALSVSAGLVNAVMSLGPWGLVALAVAAAAGAIVYFYQTNEDFRNKINEIWDGIKEKINGVIEWFKGFWSTNGETIKGQWDEVWNHISETFSSVWTSIEDIARSVGGWLQTFWQEWGGRLTTFFGNVWNNIKNIFFGSLDIIKGVFEFFAGLFTGDWGRMWEGLKTVFSGAWKVIRGVVGNAVELLQIALKLAWAAIRSVAEKAWNGIVDAAGAIWNGIVDAIRGPVDRVMQFIQENLIDKINGLFAFLRIPIHIDPIWTDKTPAVSFSGRRSGKNQAFKSGGVMPGYTPGRDVHHFYSPTGGRLDLSGGEAIMRPEWTRAVGGPAAVARMNDAAKRGQAFADGGVFQALGNIWSTLTDPVKSLKDLIARVLGGVSDNPLARLAGGLFGKGMSALVDKARDLLFGAQGLSAEGGVDVVPGVSMLPGRRLDPDTARRISAAARASGVGMQIIQGSWSNLPASMGTHRGAGAFDMLASSWGAAVSALRGQGLLAMFRNWTGNQHIHGLNPNVGGLSPEAQAQVRRAEANGGSFANGGVVKPLLFDAGGILPTGISIVKNATGRPEPLMRMDRAGGELRLSDFDIQRLAQAVSGITVRGQIAPSAFDRAMGAGVA